MTYKRLFIIIGALALVILCCVSVAAFGAYRLSQNPDIQAGLQQASSDIQKLVELSQKVKGEYPSEGVNSVLQNGHVLVVTLINPEFMEGAHALQGGKAREIASFCKQNYAEIDRIDYIQVILVKQQKALGLTTNQSTNYGFRTKELEPLDDSAAITETPAVPGVENSPVETEADLQPTATPWPEIQYWQGIAILPGAFEKEDKGDGYSFSISGSLKKNAPGLSGTDGKRGLGVHTRGQRRSSFLCQGCLGN